MICVAVVLGNMKVGVWVEKKRKHPRGSGLAKTTCFTTKSYIYRINGVVANTRYPERPIKL